MNPEALGAKCSECPLKDCVPVPCTRASGRSKLVLLSDQPGRKEVEEGELLVGQSGYIVKKNLRTIGYSLSNCHVTLTTLCAPTDKLAPKELNKAVECCRPRLLNELSTQSARVILAMGSKSLLTTYRKAKTSDFAGPPLEGKEGFEPYTIFAAPNPAITFAKPAMEPVFRIWMGRAIKQAQGRLPKWEWPEEHIGNDTNVRIAVQRIFDSKEPIAVDIETDGIDIRSCNITCIGFSISNLAASYDTTDISMVDFRFLRDMFSLPRTHIYHNGYGFDVPVLRRCGYLVGEACNQTEDTLIAHATSANMLPHSLDFITSVEFPAPRWKLSFKKGKDIWTSPELKEERMIYNARDAYMTRILWDRSVHRLSQTHNGWELYKEGMALFELGAEMTDTGILVDKESFETKRKEIRGQIAKTKKAYRQTCKKAGLKYKLGKSAAHPQLKKLFFDVFKYKPQKVSDTGVGSLDASMLEEIIASDNQLAVRLARIILACRRWYKLLSTYIDGLPLDENNVVHAQWKPYKAITGRWGCAKPNLMNVPKDKYRDGVKVTPGLRNLYIPRPGHAFLECDYSQLELRIMALLSQDEKLLDWYDKGIDVHAKTAEEFFGAGFTKKDRNLAKAIEYAFNYNLSDDVTQVCKTLVQDHPGLTMRDVKKFRRKWFMSHPAIREWQWDIVHQTQEKKYVEEFVSGRREYFHNGIIDPNKVLNYPIQALAGTLMNRAILAFSERMKNIQGSILLQVHDAVIGESRQPELWLRACLESMDQEVTHLGNSMSFPGDASIGIHWGEMKEIKSMDDYDFSCYNSL